MQKVFAPRRRVAKNVQHSVTHVRSPLLPYSACLRKFGRHAPVRCPNRSRRRHGGSSISRLSDREPACNSPAPLFANYGSVRLQAEWVCHSARQRQRRTSDVTPPPSFRNRTAYRARAKAQSTSCTIYPLPGRPPKHFGPPPGQRAFFVPTECGNGGDSTLADPVVSIYSAKQESRLQASRNG